MKKYENQNQNKSIYGLISKIMKSPDSTQIEMIFLRKRKKSAIIPIFFYEGTAT